MKAQRSYRIKIYSNKKIILILFLTGIATLLGYLLLNQYNEKNCVLRLPDNTACIDLERVSSEEMRIRGLSGRESMSDNQGMLFIFEQAGEHCFWMKDMNFSLDMIWLNANKQVIHQESKVDPATYPQSFCPDEPAQYVIELKAGLSAQLGIKEGNIIPVR